jgi:hypothetical protein
VTYRPPTLLFGDSSPPEFAAVRAWLRTHGDVVEARPHDDEQLRRRIAANWHPELVVGLQNRPGQWLEDDLTAFTDRWPLAAFVTLQGSWCEGEPRTARPLPGIARVLWHQWEAAFGLFWEAAGERTEVGDAADATKLAGMARTTGFVSAAVSDDRPAAWRHPWRQPRIRSVNENWLDPFPPSADRLPPGCLIGIDSAEPAGFDALADVIRSIGALVARFRPESPGDVRGASVIIWDEPGWSRTDGERLAACVRAARGTPVVALFGIVRWEDWRRAESLGVAVSLAKPFQLSHLLWHLNRISRIPRGAIMSASGSDFPGSKLDDGNGSN